MKKITREEIEAGLIDIIQNRKPKVDVVPDGWITVAEAAAMLHMSFSQVTFLLGQAAKEGRIPPAKRLRREGSKRNRVVMANHYYVVGKIK